jgi:hypothetical protein
MIVMSGNWWAPQTVTGGCTPGGTPLCAGGGTMSAVDIKIGRVTGASGEQTLKLKASVLLPQSTNQGAMLAGAQILLEDLGNGSAPLFELTEATTPVPEFSAATCDARDGWKLGSKISYRNVSTALDPPACTLGSARGLQRLQYRVRSAFDLDLSLTAKGATIAPPVGPIRATIVFGTTAAAGDAGDCALSGAVSCAPAGSSIRCR